MYSCREVSIANVKISLEIGESFERTTGKAKYVDVQKTKTRPWEIGMRL